MVHGRSLRVIGAGIGIVLVLQEREKEEMTMPEAEPNAKPSKLPKVELGSNSLLIIALIVGVCSGSEHRGQNETHKEIQHLRQAVERLEKKVDGLVSVPPASSAAQPAR